MDCRLEQVKGMPNIQGVLLHCYPSSRLQLLANSCIIWVSCMAVILVARGTGRSCALESPYEGKSREKEKVMQPWKGEQGTGDLLPGCFIRLKRRQSQPTHLRLSSITRGLSRSMYSQELDSNILMDPFQFGISYDY